MTAREFDSNGWFEVKDNPLSKVGVFPYMGSMIDPTGAMGLDPEGIYQVYRSEKELSSPETIESFKLLPWVDDHLMLGDDFDAAEGKGVQGVIGEDVRFEGKFLIGNIKLFSDSQAAKVDAGKRELSCGYRCEYELKDGTYGDEKYGVVQTNIRGNHLASVDEGRMGSEVAVLDSLTFAVDTKDFEAMAKTKTLQDFAQDGVEEKEVAPALQLIASALVKLETAALDAADPDDTEKAEDEKEEEEKAEDMKEEEKAEDEKEEEEKAEDEKEKEKPEGMDALEAKVTGLSKDLRAQRKSGFKDVMREVHARDALYEKVSPTIGAFDPQDMTAEDLAVYACDKLELKVEKGQAITAVNAYFTNRLAPQLFGIDASIEAGAEKGSGAVDEFFKGDA